MDVKGILEKKLGEQSGKSERTGNEWKSSEWLLTIPGPRTKHIKLEVRGPERCKQWDDFFNNMPEKNVPVNVRFEIDAREYEGKWFNSIEAWDISMATGW